MKRCNKCKLEYNNEINYCKKCGTELEQFESEEEKQAKEKAKQDRKKKWNIARYIFGAIIIISSLANPKGFKFYDFVGILFGISLFPIIYNYLFNKKKDSNKMIKIKKIVEISVPILLGIIYWMCLQTKELESILIKDDGHVIAVNEKYQINFSTNLMNIKIDDFDFTSSDNSIAIVEHGIITGLRDGNVTITIKGKNSVESKANYNIKYVNIDTIEITGDTRVLIGETKDLKVNITPSIVSDKIVKWDSSDPTKISVDNNGKITANEQGKSTITVTTEKGKTARIEVGAYMRVNSMEIADKSARVEKGKNVSLKLNIDPSNADLNGIEWSSSDTNVATVKNGVVSGISEGNVTIVATSVNGVKAESNVEVYEVKPESIKLNKASISLTKGETATITATVSPSNASDKTIRWRSSSSYVASVENGKIKAVGRGTATITAETSNGRSASVSVTVKEKSPITITAFRHTKDYVCGVEWNFAITNNTKKTINYINLKWYNFNAVGDYVYDTIDGKNYTALRYTGPLKAGKNTGIKRNTTKFYNCSYNYSTISEIKIEYADGISETIRNSEFDTYTGLIKK